MNLEELAAGWVQHLRSGGTTTWHSWRADESRGSDDYTSPGLVTTIEQLPGAAHLELMRRVSGLADEITRTRAMGRGLTELTLPGLGAAGRAPVVEPEDLSARELLRVAVPLLVDLCDSGPVPVQTRGPRRPWSRPFRIAGCAPQARAVREALIEAGRTPGGRRPTVFVIAAPLPDMMAGHWRQRVHAGSGVRWQRTWAIAKARDAVPARVDPVGLADKWAAKVGAERVRIVVAHDSASAARLTFDALGVGKLPTEPAGFDARLIDLTRRMNQVLALHGSKIEAADVRTRVAELTRRCGAITQSRLGPPPRLDAWAQQMGDRLHERILASGYPVLGDARLVIGPRGPVARSVPAADTLDLALHLLRVLATQRRTTGSGRADG